jgi:FMN phosphatase YigB (HAD superfamily)
MAIKHIWFDFSETIAHINKGQHEIMKYAEYAKAVDKPVTEQLKAEFEEQYELHHNSISDIFYSLGKPSGWWSGRLATINATELFSLIEDDIPQVLAEIKQFVPISIFSNIDLGTALPALGIDTGLFDHVISSGMVSKPKPALDGFHKIVELSQMPADQILYIGDHVTKDIIPAQTVGLQAGIIWSQSDQADYNFASFEEVLALAKGPLYQVAK